LYATDLETVLSPAWKGFWDATGSFIASFDAVADRPADCRVRRDRGREPARRRRL